MADNFQWTDELVWEFTVDLKRKQTNDPIQTRMELFKASKSNKPLFKTEDGVDIFEDVPYFKLWRNHGWTYAKYYSSKGGEYPNDYVIDCFSSEEVIKDYILHNKPVFSVNDILGNIPIKDEVFTSEINFEKYVMQLAKEKLNK